jgi:hypothetical protein
VEEKMAAIEAIAAREKKRAAQAIRAAQRGASRRAKRATKVPNKKKAGFGARQLRGSMQDMIEEAAKENGVEGGIELVVQNAEGSSVDVDALMPLAEFSGPDNIESLDVVHTDDYSGDNAHYTEANDEVAGHRSTHSFFKHESDDGHHYYEHAETGETQWELPEEAEVIDMT